MSTETKRYVGAGLIAVGLFLFWSLDMNGWKRVGALRAAVAERSQLRDDRQAALAKVGTLYDDYQQKVSGDIERKFGAVIPVKKDIPELISSVQTIAGNAGMNISELQINEQKQETAQTLKTLGITLRMEGDYAGFRSFLSNLENNVRLLTVDTLSIGTQQNGQMTFELHAFGYFLK